MHSKGHHYKNKALKTKGNSTLIALHTHQSKRAISVHPEAHTTP